MKRILFIILSLFLLFSSTTVSAQCCGNGICEVGEDSISCPSDCGVISNNCPGLGQFANSIDVASVNLLSPISYVVAEDSGYCTTFKAPYPTRVCFEFMVPSGSVPMYLALPVQGFGCGGIPFTTTVGNGTGSGCGSQASSGFHPGIITGMETYDSNCSLIFNGNFTFGNFYTGSCSYLSGLMAPGDIVTLCFTLNQAAVCDSFSICPTFYCGAEDCATAGQSTICPPFNLTSSTTIDPCTSVPNSGEAIVTPDCGSHFSYLWNDAATQTDSLAVNLVSGNYNVIITNDSFACDTTISVIVDALIPPKTTNIDLSICDGDSILLEGNFQYVAGDYYDTLAAVSTCDSIIITTLIVNPKTIDSLKISICDGDSVNIGGVFESDSGVYQQILKTSFNCDSIIITTVSLIPYPKLILTSDTSIEFGQDIQLEASGANNYIWSPETWLNCTDCSSPIAEPKETITYVVSTSLDPTCIVIDSVNIEVIKEELIFYSSFSPNSDGENDKWRITGIYQYPEATVRIYNRWGRTVFESKSNYDGNEWDGLNRGGILVSESVYYYVVNLNDGLKEITGTITLIK